MKSIIIFYLICLTLYFSTTRADSAYEDARCKCVCTIINGTQRYKKLFITPVPSDNDCDEASIPVFNKTEELCPRCECTYESRNTTIIRYVIGFVLWIISLLVIYMLFLLCLDPLLNKKAKNSYVEHTNEEDDSTSVGGISSHQMGVRNSTASMGGLSVNVLDRVGHQQDKWRRQVREQRRNIYDRHTMLN